MGKICIWKGLLRVQYNIAISNNRVFVLGCPKAIKPSVRLNRFGWPELSRTENISRRAGKVDYSTPLCLRPVFVSAAGADYGRQGPGQSHRGRAAGAGRAAPLLPTPAPGDAGRPTALPQVTPAAALRSAFLGFGFSGVWLLLFLCRHFCPTLEFGLACALVLSDLGSSHKSLARFVWALKYRI